MSKKFFTETRKLWVMEHLLFTKQYVWVLKSKIFYQISTYLLKGNHYNCTLWIHPLTILQKLGIILENKVLKKLKFSKNVNNKKCTPKLILFNENFFGKFRIICDIENWLWKSKFCNFWQCLLNWMQDLKIFYRADYFPWA